MSPDRSPLLAGLVRAETPFKLTTHATLLQGPVLTVPSKLRASSIGRRAVPTCRDNPQRVVRVEGDGSDGFFVVAQHGEQSSGLQTSEKWAYARSEPRSGVMKPS
jgi:hypothetical protein